MQNSAPTVTAPATSDFGSVLANSVSVNKIITLTNTWLISAQAGTATVTGSNASLFTIGTDTCSGFAITSNGTCQITVSYAPTAAAAHTATLTVPIIGAASPTLVSLTGSAGSTALTTSDVTPATVAVGQSTTVNLSYTNPNATAMKTGAIILSQPAIMATSPPDYCSNTMLAAGASCTVTVTVSPATVGSYSGTATLSFSGGGGTATATIAGTANAPVPASSGGGGGCSIMPFGADPDVSLLLAMLAVAAYWLRRRVVCGRSAD